MEYKKLLRLNLNPILCEVGRIGQIRLNGPVQIKCLQGDVRFQLRQEFQVVSNIKGLVHHIEYSKAQQESLEGGRGKGMEGWRRQGHGNELYDFDPGKNIHPAAWSGVRL